MHCTWKESEAYRYAEGSLEPQREEAFADHLRTCAICRERVAEAQRVEGLLGARLTPVAAPVTLASRVAGAVALEREEVRGDRRRPWFPNWEWPQALRGRAASLALSGLALVLALSLTARLVAPGAVTALVRQMLYFVPGLGIEQVGDGTLVAKGPVSVEVGGTTFAVEALVSDGEQTTVKYAIAGLPGGKGGWGESRGGERPLVLRVDAEREYMLLTQHAGYGGGPEETTISGEMIFPPVPAEVRSVELIVPVDYLVPPAVLPGSDSMTWALSIPLVPPAESSLPAATPQSAEATVEGITLRAAASAVDADRTVILVEGEAEGDALLRTLGRNGGKPVDAAILRDEQGREYRRQTEDGVVVHRQPFRQDLYFEPLARGAATLTFEVPVVQVMLDDAVEVTIPIAGWALGEDMALDRTVDLAGYPVRLVSARVDHDPSSDDERLWLYIEVDLGPEVEGRTLAAFGVDSLSGGGPTMMSLGRMDGQQMTMFGVTIAPDATEVTVRLANPIIDVEGPWVLTVPVDGRS